jgi:hypothetical protein
MNDHLENITPLAEKLQQVTLPHVEEGWESMKTLLNNEMPAAQNKHWKRWLLLLLLLLLFIGLCNSPAILKWSGLTANKHAAAQYLLPFNKKEATPNTMPSLDSKSDSFQIIGDVKIIKQDSSPKPHNKKQKTGKKGPINYSRNAKIIVQKMHPFRKGGVNMIHTLANNHQINVEERNEEKNRQTKISKDLLAGDNEHTEQDYLMNDSNLSFKKNEPGFIPVVSSKKIENAVNLNSKKDKQILELNTQKLLVKKKAKSDPTADEKGFLFAVGINHYFPVSNQKKINVKSNGGSSGVIDYIPVPVVRYYFHKWLYAETEVQFIAPQYTKTLLASNSISMNPSNQNISKSVFIKKLFYFNLPVSIHYRPVKNVFVGAGIEYSMLTNGVALFENSKSYTLSTSALPLNDPLLVSSEIGSLKKAPAYGELRTNEFRYLFDVNYQWKPFTIGLRYNHAFTNFINARISNTVITQAYNASLELNLRYTIWDHRKKVVHDK